MTMLPPPDGAQAPIGPPVTDHTAPSLPGDPPLPPEESGLTPFDVEDPSSPTWVGPSALQQHVDWSTAPQDEGVAFEVRPLTHTSLPRILVIAAQLLALPVALLGARSVTFVALGQVFAVVSLLALLAWTGIAVANVGRVRSASRHSKPPRPVVAMLSWLLAPVVAVPGILALQWMAEWRDEASVDAEGGRSLMFVGAVLLFALILLVAMYRPYAILAAASRWVSGDPDKFRRWFIAPFVAAILAGIAYTLIALTIGANESNAVSEPDSAVIVFTAGSLAVATLLPWIAWIVFAAKAMVDLDDATKHHHRRLTDQLEAVDGPHVAVPTAALTPQMAAQVEAQATEPVEPQ